MPSPIKWQRFEPTQIHLALVWARDGIALIQTHPDESSQSMSYMIGPSPRRLCRAAERVGLTSEKLVRHRIPALYNFQLSGRSLHLALWCCQHRGGRPIQL